MPMRNFFCFIVLPASMLLFIAIIIFVFSAYDNNAVKVVDCEFVLQQQPNGSEERYTLLDIETDFGGEMTYRVSGKNVTEIVVSIGVSQREEIEVFSFPEVNNWVYTSVERHFAWNSEDQRCDSNLTRSFDINRYYFSGSKLLKSICLLGNKSDISIEKILTSRKFFLDLAKQNRKSANVESLKNGYPACAKDSGN